MHGNCTTPRHFPLIWRTDTLSSSYSSHLWHWLVLQNHFCTALDLCGKRIYGRPKQTSEDLSAKLETQLCRKSHSSWEAFCIFERNIPILGFQFAAKLRCKHMSEKHTCQKSVLNLSICLKTRSVPSSSPLYSPSPPPHPPSVDLPPQLLPTLAG